jgi:hypothetical protein
MDMQTQANGNNETSLRGICELHGKFTAHTGTSSKTFKTREGAVKWLSKFWIDANGDRIPH